MDNTEKTFDDHIEVLRHLLNDLRSEASNPSRHQAHNQRKREQAESLTYAIKALTGIDLGAEKVQ